MGYCCKSRVLELPAMDKVFPTNSGTFRSKARFFDFSKGGEVPLQENATLANRPDVCKPEMKFRGDLGTYRLEGIHPDLKACIARVYLRGCEALYLRDMVDVSKVCGAQAKLSNVETESVLKNRNATCTNHVLHQNEVVVDEDRPTLETLGNSGGGRMAGSLVIHIRSGDIFDLNFISKMPVIGGFGQPPLGYYLRVISSQPWSNVSILTSGGRFHSLNPVFEALKNMTTNGQLGPNVNLYQDRSLVADFNEMICADALAISRSSFHLLTTAFTRASTIFLPVECGSGRYTRGKHDDKVAAENSTVLKLERPETEVYGIEWRTGQESYSVYGNWSYSKQQLEEMLNPDTVTGLQQCCV